MSASEAAPTLSVLGLGKLGSVVAACHAARGFPVIGVDVNEAFVESVRRGKAPVVEPRLDELFAESGDRLTATTDAVQAVLDSQATLLVVPTPSLEDGAYSLEYVKASCQKVGEALRRKDDYHLVVLKSTVLPGGSDEVIVPLLEEISGKSCGTDFGYCYNPEFIALGSVVKNIFEPDLVLVGESDEVAGERLMAIYERLHRGERRPTARMTPVNAEVAKLCVNTYVTMKITYANALGRLCERLPGGDADAVTAALGLDTRIGSRYLGKGLGFGGPCFPRDNQALLSIARRLGVPFALAETTDRENPAFTGRVADLVTERTPAGSRVGVLGLSYKPQTPVIDESQALALAAALAENGFTVVAYDPLAIDNARQALGDRIKYAESAQACIDGVDAVVIATPWPEFAGLDFASADAHVYDCWGLLRERRKEIPRLWELGVNERALRAQTRR